MRDVTYSLNMSLDGFITDPDGGLDWGAPDDEVFAHSTAEVEQIGVHVLGRRLYETMLYWEDIDPATLSPAEQHFADVWNRLPKVVFSRTLESVRGQARLSTNSLADEIEQLRTASQPGSVAIGGADLAAQAAALGLIDEYWVRIHPVVLGGGTPFFALDGRREHLELIDSRTFDSGVTFVRYRLK